MTHRLKDLLAGALFRHGISGVVVASDVIQETNRIIEQLFGKEFTRRAHATQYRDNTVVIDVNSSVIASELGFQERRMLSELHGRGIVLSRIQIRQRDF